MFVRSLSIGVAAVAIMASGAQAADLFIPTAPQPIYEAAGFSWDGLYAGVQVGGVFTNIDEAAPGTETDLSFGVIGAHVGANFTVADPILVGIELQGNYAWNSDLDISSGEFLALGRVGAVVTDQVLVYGAAGVGTKFSDDIDYESDGVFDGSSTGIYAFGGGVEVAVTDAISIRGEILGIGYFEDDAADDFFDEARATVGVSYHF